MGNNNSSRYGVVTQLQFDDGDIPKMVGSLNRTYLLEKSRVVSRSSRERNFHVFYQMVGSDDEEFKKSLQLSGLTPPFICRTAAVYRCMEWNTRCFRSNVGLRCLLLYYYCLVVG